MEKLFVLAGAVFPAPARFRGRLARDTAELSRLLTSARGERGASYLGKDSMLSAYLRCFLPWNVYRLSRLLPSLPLALSDGDTVADLGSGPLTLPIALWISRPELRPLRLVFRCVDRARPALEAGKGLFAALSSPGTAWTINTVRGDILRRYGRHGRGGKPEGAKPALVCAANVYNELYWDIPHSDSRSLARFAGQQARLLAEEAADGAPVLVVEPGVPRSGEFIALLRAAFAELGRPALSPCPCGGPCPFPGGRGGRGLEKRKWCHFAFDTGGAPEKLKELSAAAGIPKEKAVLSFLLAGGAGREAAGGGDAARFRPGGRIAVRVLSGKFPVAGKGVPAPRAAASGAVFGSYGCSVLGAVLLTGTERETDAAPPGTLLRCSLPGRESRDGKSGALILDSSFIIAE